MRERQFLILGLFGLSVLFLARVHAATNSFKQTSLVSDTAGMAPVTDPGLINPWGVAFFPGNPFWVADNNSGVLLAATGCGGYNSAGGGTAGTPRGTRTVVITGTSGSTTHSSSVSLTVN